MTAAQDKQHRPRHVAIIGAGFISDYHVAGLRAAGGAEVTVLVGRDRERTKARARTLGIGRAETEIGRVLDDKGIDAVVIATPDNTHHELATAALDAGKPVLLQKPMGLDTAECRSLVATARRTGTRLSVSFMHRYFPEVLWLRDELASGRLGPVHAVRQRNATPGADWADWLYRPGAAAGGVVMQLGVHGIDLLRHLFGPIATLSASCRTARPERRLKDGRVVTTGFEDNATALYGFSAGFGASHEMSYTEPGGTDRFRLELVTEKATIWLRSAYGPAAMFAPELTGSAAWTCPDLVDEPLGAAHHRHWLAVLRGEAEDDTAAAGLASIFVAETIYAAAAAGRRLDVEAA